MSRFAENLRARTPPTDRGSSRVPGFRILLPLLATILFLISIPPSLAAQGANAFRFEHLDTADGLSHDYVFSVLQDRRGFLWIATEDGLNRYDGQEFVVFQHNPLDPTSLGASDAGQLLEDRDGKIWVGTWGKGLDLFDPMTETVSHYRHDPEDPTSLGGDFVMALHEGSDGSLWVGSRRGGLSRLDRESGTWERFRSDPEAPGSLAANQIWDIVTDRDERLWVATDDGLSRFDPILGLFVSHRHDPEDPSSLLHNRVRALLVDRVGTLWVATDRGLQTLPWGSDGEFQTPALPAPVPFVNALLEDRHEKIWLGTRDDGAFRLDPESGALLQFVHSPADPASLSHNDVQILFEDDSGNLWIGGRGGGLNKTDLKPRKFALFKPENNPGFWNNNRISAFHQDWDGTIWVGTGTGLGRLTDREEGVFVHDQDEPYDPRNRGGAVLALLSDSEERLWAGTSGRGLHLVDRRTGERRVYRHDPADAKSLSHDSVRAIAEGRGGILWLCTGRGLDRFNPASGEFDFVSLVERRDSEALRELSSCATLLGDRRGDLWVGSHGDGLARLDARNGRVQIYRHDPENPQSLSNDRVFDLHRSEEGDIWIGTDAGLNRFDDASSTFEVFLKADGLPSDRVYGILEDEVGALWLTTGDGISRFEPESGRFRGYGLADGLQGRIFNPGAVYRGPGGEMFVGGRNGFNVFSPRKVEDNPHSPALALTDFKVFNQDRETEVPPWALEEIVLFPEDAVFSLDFAALDLTAPERNRYRYMLEGFNDSWIEQDYGRITFTGLPSGEYLLRVQGSNNDAVWGRQERTLKIFVRPAFWATPWFRGGLAVLSLVLLSLAYRVRTRAMERRTAELEEVVALRTADLEEHARRLEKANEEVRRFVNLVSHDLRSPVITARGFIAELDLAFEQLRIRIAPALDALSPAERAAVEAAFTEDVPEALRFVESSTNHMDAITSGILKLARLEERTAERKKVDLDTLVRRVVEGLSPAIEKKGARVIVEPLPVLLSDRLAMERIFDNLLSNALRYLDPERPGKIIVKGWRNKAETVVEVRDNGIGIEAKDLPEIFEAFRRVGPQKVPGLGMGLAYVKTLMEQLDGSIECRSNPGVGSTFSVKISHREGEDLPGVPSPEAGGDPLAQPRTARALVGP